MSPRLEWSGYPTVKKVDRFDRIHECDRQTDGRTDGWTDTTRRHMPRLCMASRGKKSQPIWYIAWLATRNVPWIRKSRADLHCDAVIDGLCKEKFNKRIRKRANWSSDRCITVISNRFHLTTSIDRRSRMTLLSLTSRAAATTRLGKLIEQFLLHENFHTTGCAKKQSHWCLIITPRCCIHSGLVF